MTTAPIRHGSRGRLREATQGAHARVDACFPDGLDGIGSYRRYLRGMHALAQAIDAGLAAANLDPTWRAWRHPQRMDWLREDLADLELAPLPAGPGLALQSGAEAAGALYVLEGSALGATRLLADVRAMGWNETRGARFLHGHGGAGAGERWRHYLACLGQARFEAQDERATLEAAARTFAYAEHEFLRAAQAGGADA